MALLLRNSMVKYKIGEPQNGMSKKSYYGFLK